MKWTALKRRLSDVVGLMGGYHLSEILTHKHIRILLYHRFSKERENRKTNHAVFEKQVNFLVKSYHIASLQECVYHLLNNTKLNKPLAVITIDDGYRDFYQYAYPVLRKYNSPATVFLTTGFIDRKLWLWPDLIEYIVYETQKEEFDFINIEDNSKVHLPLKETFEKKHAWNVISSACLKMKDSKKWQYIDQLKEQLDVVSPEIPIDYYEPLTWGEIREMSQNNIEFGSHTITHPILTNIPENKLDYEIKKSKDILENMLQMSVYSFCYPNGTSSDYNEVVKEKVKEAAYTSAVTAINGLNNRNQDAYELRRIACGQQIFKKNVTGFAHVIEQVKKIFPQ